MKTSTGPPTEDQLLDTMADIVLEMSREELIEALGQDEFDEMARAGHEAVESALETLKRETTPQRGPLPGPR